MSVKAHASPPHREETISIDQSAITSIHFSYQATCWIFCNCTVGTSSFSISSMHGSLLSSHHILPCTLILLILNCWFCSNDWTASPLSWILDTLSAGLACVSCKYTLKIYSLPYCVPEPDTSLVHHCLCFSCQDPVRRFGKKLGKWGRPAQFCSWNRAETPSVVTSWCSFLQTSCPCILYSEPCSKPVVGIPARCILPFGKSVSVGHKEMCYAQFCVTGNVSPSNMLFLLFSSLTV